jgi:hypothetical protein
MAFAKKKSTKPKLADDPKVQEAARAAALAKARHVGPSKTQVCDAIRSAAPGAPMATVDAIAGAVMRLYREG